MSFDRAAVENAIRTFANAAVAIPWIFANQEGDRPPRPYGTIYVQGADPIGMGDIQSVGTGVTITERVREYVELEVSFQTYGDGALDRMARIVAWAKRPSVTIGALDTVLLGFLSAGPIRDLSQVFAQSWEARAQCDLRFSLRANDDRSISTIGRVDISGAGVTQTVQEP